MTDLKMPFLDLFEQMRSAGIPLTMEQYDLLRQALKRGYGWQDWDALRRLCELVWYRPGFEYEKADFDRVLDEYIQVQREIIQDWMRRLEPEKTIELKFVEPLLGVLPKLPPRKSSESPKVPQSGKTNGLSTTPSAVKTTPKPVSRTVKKPSRFVVRDMPISLETVQRTWRSLRRPLPDVRIQEIDIEATIERMSREGIFSDVVERPAQRQQTELVLLMDGGSGMLAYRPVWEPLVNAIERRLVSGAQIYRFTSYPSDYFYEWQRPMQDVAIGTVLSKLHKLRSVVVIVSDGGAASQSYRESQIDGMKDFLGKLAPCVREILWLNPVPRELWPGTSVEEIGVFLKKPMVTFDRSQWQSLTQQVNRGGRQ